MAFMDNRESSFYEDSAKLPKHGPRHSAGQIEIPDDPVLGRWTPVSIVLLILGLLGFGAITALVVTGGKGPLGFDSSVLDLVVNNLRGSDKITEVITEITMIAMPPALVVVAAAISSFADGPRATISAVLCGGMGWGLNEVLKRVIARPRPPEELRLAVETSASFPSGHSITVMAFYGFVIWLIWHYQSNKTWATAMCVAVGICIAFVGLSRIYLAVHWTSDVLAGFCLGLAWLILFTRLIAPHILKEEPVR